MHLPDNTLLRNGAYRIVRFISSGGFGCTYEAVHTMLEQRVAIKEFFVKNFCNRDSDTSGVSIGTMSQTELVMKLKQKFISEAKALSHLKHPNIVHVTDVFEENGTAYYVMDYVDGVSLGDMVEQNGPINEQVVLNYMMQVCDALRYVHAHNRLHLDIKPDNIMIDSYNRAVLIDFGASKQYDEAGGENTSTLLGMTPGYAPLEQMFSSVGAFMPATDVYSVGATMYKLLTGEKPKPSNQLAAGEQLAPLPDYITPNTCNAIYSAMQINKNARPQSIDEFMMLLTGAPYAPDPVYVSQPPQPPVSNPPFPPDENSIPPQPVKKGMSTAVKLLIGIAAVIVLLAVVLIMLPSGKDTDDSDNGKQDTTVVVNTAEVVKQKEFDIEGKHKFKYTGPIENGLPNGIGKAEYSDGVYEGAFVDGKRNGKGKFVANSGENTFEGEFANDIYSNGKLTLSDGSYYEGTFSSNGDFKDGKWYTKDGTEDGVVKDGKEI